MPESHQNVLFPGRSGAVSLTFDDGTTNQLEKAVSPLDDRGLKGTFYLNPRDSVMDRFADDWRDVASRGHEIGNHSLRHPCPAAITGGRGLEDMRIDEIEEDIRAAQSRLNRIAPGQTDWTFAYPCYSTFVGRGLKRASYVPVVARSFLAGRAGGEFGFANHPDRLDLSALVGTPVERLGASEIVEFVRRMTASGHWVILVLHDIEEGILPVARDHFLATLDYLTENRDRFVVAPVVEVAQMLVADQLTPHDRISE